MVGLAESTCNAVLQGNRSAGATLNIVDLSELALERTYIPSPLFLRYYLRKYYNYLSSCDLRGAGGSLTTRTMRRRFDMLYYCEYEPEGTLH